jgi:hypothetical protein
MLKRISVLLALLVLVGGSGYLLSSKWHSDSTAASSRPAQTGTEGTNAEATSVVIPEGTEIEVRLLNTLSTKSNRVGDQFSASIERPIQVDGKDIVPRDSTVLGVVTSVKESGRLKGRSYISLRLQSIELKGGKKLDVATNSVSRLGASNRNRNLALMGGGAGIGAGIGAIAAGGKGLAIGGPVGFGAGLATKALIRGHEVTIPSETLLHFKLKEPMNVNLT